MTNGEKIAELINIRDNFNYTLTPREVFDDAIKALEQEDVIDHIRAELIQSIQNGTLKIESGNEELFRIIDKYKTERK